MLESYVYRFFNATCRDALAQLDMNYDRTLKDLPQALAKVNRFVRRHTSTIFRFKKELITFYGKQPGFRILEPGTGLWNQMMIKPYFVRELDIDWSKGASLPLDQEIWKCPLSNYLLSAMNMPHTILFFYAFLGRLLHQPRQHDKWSEIISIVCEAGESILVQLLKLLFEPQDVRVIAPSDNSLDPGDRPPQLVLCYFKPQKRSKAKIPVPKLYKDKHHFVLYGDILHNAQVTGRTVVIHDFFATANSSAYLILRSHLPQIINLAHAVYWNTVTMLGSREGSFSPEHNLDNLKQWIDFWRIPCPVCQSRKFCVHIFDKF
jgi:hypothetical protein